MAPARTVVPERGEPTTNTNLSSRRPRRSPSEAPRRGASRLATRSCNAAVSRSPDTDRFSQSPALADPEERNPLEGEAEALDTAPRRSREPRCVQAHEPRAAPAEGACGRRVTRDASCRAALRRSSRRAAARHLSLLRVGSVRCAVSLGGRTMPAVGGFRECRAEFGLRVPTSAAVGAALRGAITCALPAHPSARPSASSCARSGAGARVCRNRHGAEPGTSPRDGVDSENRDLVVPAAERVHVVDGSLQRAARVLHRDRPTP